VLVVVTRLSPRSLSALRATLSLSGTVVRQLADLQGFTGGRLLVDRRRDLWTLTTWSDRAALAVFGQLHAPVAARIGELASSMATSGWQQATQEVPPWSAVRARWTDGPGPAHGLSRPLAAGRALTPA
jgi:hypothetical protein